MNPGDESHPPSLPTGGKLGKLKHLRAGLYSTGKKIHPQIPIPTQTPTLCLRPSPRAHKLAHLHSSLTHPHKHTSRSTALSLTFKSQTGGSPPRPTLAGLQTSTKHTRSPLRDHSCPASSRKHTLAAKQAASPESRSPSNPRGRVLSPELPRVTST